MSKVFRAVEPALGMSFTVSDSPGDEYKIVEITDASIRGQTRVKGCGSASFSCRLDWWRSQQATGDIAPILWTVAKDNDRFRLGWNKNWNGTFVVDIWLISHYGEGYACGTKQNTSDVCLWPTKPAAIAAARAIGWGAPIVRRVVRRP